MDLSKQSNLIKHTKTQSIKPISQIGDANIENSITISGNINGATRVNGIVSGGQAQPSSASLIITKNSKYEFPTIGDEKCLYISTSENKAYRFDEVQLKYYAVGSDYEDIKIINGGCANEY